MGGLGTLWFDVNARDNASRQLAEIRKRMEEQLKDVRVGVTLGHDASRKLIEQVQKGLELSTVRIENVKVNNNVLTESIRQALQGETFKVRIAAENVTGAVRTGLSGGVTGGGASGRSVGMTGGMGLTELQRYSAEIAKTSIEIGRLRIELDNLRAVSRMASKSGDMKSYNQAKKDIENLNMEINRLKGNLLGLRAAQTNARVALQSHTNSQRESVRAANSMSDAHRALQKETGNTSVISQKLTSVLGSMFNTEQALNFLRSVIRIGGQLEQQRVSIGAILHDSSHANDLFGKLKSMALQSPFGVVDLDKYTKQLSAYGFQYNELYDMTKRLADISAGAGTDIGRLALALGHVRSETALTGITLRQFSMNNIPMLKELSRLYTELEGRIVTTAEVRKRISDKEVGYDDVIEVIRKMTDEGGQFYNMQAVMADTLAGKWKNVADAIDLMFGEIGESSVGGALKGVAEITLEATKNWETLLRVVGEAVVVFGTLRAVTLLNNAAYSAYNNRLTVFNLGLRELTSTEAKNLVTTGQLTKQRLLNAVATGKLSAETAELAAMTFGVSRAQLDEIATSKMVGANLKANTIATSTYTVAQLRQMATVRSASPHLWKLSMAWTNLTTVMKGAGAAMKGMLAGSLPAVGLIAAIEVATQLWQSYKENGEQAKEVTRKVFEAAQEGLKNVRSMMEETGMRYELLAEGTTPKDITPRFGEDVGGKTRFVLPEFDDLNEAEVSQVLERWTQFIKDYAARPNEILQDSVRDASGKVRSLREQFESLGRSVADVAEGYRLMSTVSDAMGYAVEETGGWLNDNIIENIKDYDEAVKGYGNAVSEYFSKYEKEAIKGIAAAKNQDAAFAKAAESCSTYAQQFKLLAENYKTYDKAASAYYRVTSDEARIGYISLFGYTRGYKTSKIRSTDDARAEMERDFDKMYDALKAKLATEGWDLKNLTAAQKEALLLQSQTMFKGIENISEETRRNVLKMWADKLTLSIDDNTAEKIVRLSEMEQYLLKITDKEWIVKLKLDKAGTFEELYDKLDKNVKEAGETMKKLRDGLTKDELAAAEGGIVPDKELSGKQLEYRKAYELRKEAMRIADKEGFKLSSLEKEKKKAGGNKKDAELAMWKERISLLEKYYTEYEKYEKKYGRAKAEDVLRNDGNFSALWKYFKDPTDYAGSLREAMGHLQGGSQARVAERDTLNASIGKFGRELEMKAIDAASKELEKVMKQGEEAYELYKRVMKVTGDKSVAMAMAFGGTVENESYTEYLKDELGKALKAAGSGKSAAEVTGMMRLDVGVDFGESSDVMKLYDAIAEEEKKLKKESAETLLKLIEDNLSYAEQIENNNRLLEGTIAKLEKMRSLTDGAGNRMYSDSQIDTWQGQARQKTAKKNSKLKFDEFKQSSDWVKVFADLDRVSTVKLKDLMAKMEDFGRTAGLSAEETKTLQDAFKKLHDEIIERSPIKAMGDAIKKMGLAADLGRLLERKGVDDGRGGKTYTFSDEGLARKYGRKAGDTVTREDVDNKKKEATEDFNKGLENTREKFEALQGVLGPLIGLFESLGATGMSNVLSMGNNALGAASQVSGGLKALGLGSAAPWGAAIGAGLSVAGGVVSSLFAAHDNALQKEIEASEERRKLLDTLSRNLEGILEHTMGGIYKTEAPQELTDRMNKLVAQNSKVSLKNGKVKLTARNADTAAAVEEANKSHSYYDTQKALLMAQRDELQRQRAAEADKKKKSQEKLDDYDQQIYEKEQEIKNFAQEMAKELYSIDYKSWAADLAQTLVDAWASGENAVDAYKKKVTSVLKEVGTSVIAQKFLEPMLEKNMNEFMDYFDENDGKIDEKGLEILAKMYDDAEKTAKITDAYLEGMETIANRHGETLKETSDSSGETMIKGITEDQANLLLGYTNAMRCDLSLIRGYWERYGIAALESVPKMSVIAESQLVQLRAIEENTRRNADSAKAIEDFCDGLRTGVYTVRVK